MRVGILGLARSGRAAARLARARGHDVFASDAGDSVDVRQAAVEVRRLGGEAETGAHTVERLAACELIVVSPGIAPDAAVLLAPALRGVPRISELEFAFRELRAPVVAVTGTNGKSTTTALTAHLLGRAGFDAPAAGNIGLALSEVALQPKQPDWVVVEASSFQLAGIDRFAPRVGVVTNLSPDHLDRYPSVEAYYADKARLFDNAESTSVWVLNAEDSSVLDLPGEADGRRRFFRVNTLPPSGEEGGWVDAAGHLCLRIAHTETRLLHHAELRVLGLHNRANALAAAVAAASSGASAAAIADGLRTFGGLEHRLEVIAEIDGVLWVNDSKATNIASALVAVRSVERPLVLLLGGRHKGESYSALIPALQGRTRRVIAFGEAAPLIEHDLAAMLPIDRIEADFDAVVQHAARVAQAGDAVLLAPACSSFDMFRDYEERGRRFKQLVAGMSGGAA